MNGEWNTQASWCKDNSKAAEAQPSIKDKTNEWSNCASWGDDKTTRIESDRQANPQKNNK